MSEMLFVIAPEGYRGNCHSILYDGVCPYTKKTREDYEREGCKVLTYDELIPVENNFLNSLCGEWKEITEDRYHEQMDVLPPMRYTNGGFFVPEAYTGDVFNFYQQWRGKFYTSMQRSSTPRDRIIMSMEIFINNENKKGE